MLATPADRYLFGIIPWYSALIVLGIIAALILATQEEKRLSLPRDTVIDLALWVIPFGVIGARLYYVIFAWKTFAPNPISILYIWQGGLAIYGGVLGGLLAVCLFSRKRKLPVATLTDIIVPGLALAQAIGRWGNYFNMEAYGLEVTDPAWQFFPFAVLIPGHNGGSWHMATFFYESVWNLLVFIFLMFLRKKQRQRGDVTLWYMLLYGSGRLIIEGLRTDSLTAANGTFRVSQLLSVVLCITVLLCFLWHKIRDDAKNRPIKLSLVLIAGAACSVLLPRPAQAFAGYYIAWTIQFIIILYGVCFLPSRKNRAISCIAAILSAASYSAISIVNVQGVACSTLLCTAFSLTTIMIAVAAYQSKPRT